MKEKKLQAEELCSKYTKEQFLNKYNEMRNSGMIMKDIANSFNTSKYTLRKVLKEKFNIELEPGKPIKEIKFQNE